MDVKDRIVETALELFMNRGCKSVTMDDIASENGISKRTLYEFFKDKSTLLEEALLLHEQKMLEFFDVSAKTTSNVLEQFFNLHDKQNEGSINLKINFFKELKKFYPQIFDTMVKRMVCSHDDVIKSGIKRGQEEGLFRNNINIDIVSRIMMEFGSISDTFQNDVRFEKREIFKELFINYIRGLATYKGIEIIDNYLNR